MIFTNIDVFERRMVRAAISVAFFSIKYHSCVLECVYSMSQRKFLFAFVDYNVGFTLSLKGGYASAYINHQDAVEQLMNCRGHHRYDPVNFYDFLNAQLPFVEFAQISNIQYVRVVCRAVSEFENRIYFNHWRRANISERQLNKTTELMGNEVVDFCIQNTLTPVFHTQPTDRTLAVLEDFKSDHERYGVDS